MQVQRGQKDVRTKPALASAQNINTPKVWKQWRKFSLNNSSFYAEAHNRTEVEKRDTAVRQERNQELSDINENEI